MNSTSLIQRAALTGTVLATLAAPAASHATSITYRDGANAFIALQASDSLTWAEESRDGRRTLLEHDDHVFELVAPNAAGDYDGCTIRPSGDDLTGGGPRASLSADGQLVALADASGVRVARVASISDGQDCALSDVHVISATGGEPQFSEGPVGTTTATPGPGPGTTPNPGPSPSPRGNDGKPGPAPAPVHHAAAVTKPVLVLGTLTRAQIGTGVAVKVRTAAAGTVRITVAVKGRTVLSGTATARRGGTVTVHLHRAGRRAVVARGAKAKITLAFRPRRGPAVRVSRTLTVRR